jgi:hypothetical protein
MSKTETLFKLDTDQQIFNAEEYPLDDLDQIFSQPFPREKVDRYKKTLTCRNCGFQGSKNPLLIDLCPRDHKGETRLSVHRIMIEHPYLRACQELNRWYFPLCANCHVFQLKKDSKNWKFQELPTMQDILLLQATSRPKDVSKNAFRSRVSSLKNKVQLIETLHGQSCQDCGFDDWRILEFDHVKGNKKNDVANMMQRSRSSVRKEIAKCELVCPGCHRVRERERESK